MNPPGTPLFTLPTFYPPESQEAESLFKSIGHLYPLPCPNPGCPSSHPRRRIFTQEWTPNHLRTHIVPVFMCLCKQDIVSCSEMISRLRTAPLEEEPSTLQDSASEECYDEDDESDLQSSPESPHPDLLILQDSHEILSVKHQDLSAHFDALQAESEMLKIKNISQEAHLVVLSTRIDSLTAVTQELQESNKNLAALLHEYESKLQLMLKASQDSDRLQDLLKQENMKLQQQLNDSASHLSKAACDITALHKSMEQVKLHVHSSPAHPVPNSHKTLAPTTTGAQSTLLPEQLSIIASMKPPPKPFRARTPKTLGPPACTPTVRVYFGNIASCPLSIFKQRLRSLRIRTSTIHNIAFVGRAICEFLVETSYKDRLISHLTECSFKYLPGYDPAVPQDNAVSAEDALRLREAYTKRLQSTVSTTTRPFVRQAFLDLLSAIGIHQDLPDCTATPMDISSDPPSSENIEP
jgi:hypothetical protein